jgi:hypothetical protein
MAVTVEVGEVGDDEVSVLGSTQLLPSERARIMVSAIMRYLIFIAFIGKLLTPSLVIIASEY